MIAPKGKLLRLRCGGSQRERFYLQCPERLFEKFAPRMQAMARDLVRAQKLVEAPIVLGEAAKQTTEKNFAAIEKRCAEICATAPVSKEVPKTFRDVAELWLNGTLCRRYPDDVKCLEGRYLARVRQICGEIYPILGHLPVAAITRELADEAKALTAKGRKQGTRRHYALAIRRVIDLSVEPLGLIEHSPLPKRFVPPQGKSPIFPFLYPEEERRLVTCPEVPFGDRLFYGVLCRTGLRVSEALDLTWPSLDLRHGTLTVGSSKTGVARFFKLEPDVLVTLQRWRRETPGDLVFSVTSAYDLAPRFREHLTVAGVSRPELFLRTAEQRPIRIHDLRATFVTLSLGMGRFQQWVMDRTGHTTSDMLSRYTRQARHAGEIDLGWLYPLDECLWPEGHPASGRPRVGHRVGQMGTIPGQIPAHQSTRDTEEALPERAGARKAAEKRTGDDRKARGGPADFVGVGQNEQARETAPEGEDPMSGDVEQEILRTLRKATDAGEWQVAQQCVTELTERRRAKAGSGVVDLDSARRKR